MATSRALRPLVLSLLVLGAAGALGVHALLPLVRPAEAASPAVVMPGSGAPMAAVDANATPVLVELFTSEGCSSCPPADAVLARLERTQPVNGVRVVPLGLHVDYWDRLGWPDPFSSARASARQRTYASLGSGSYTPQAVIDGRTETVGSRGPAVEAAVAEAAKRPHATLSAAVKVREEGKELSVSLKVGALPNGSATDAEAIVAITQNSARVAVPRGENAGSTLEHNAIVRELVVIGAVPLAGATLETSVKLPSGVVAKDLRVVAFVQERGSRRVLGTTTRDITP